MQFNALSLDSNIEQCPYHPTIKFSSSDYCSEEVILGVCINTFTTSSYLIFEFRLHIVRDQRVECEWCSDRLIVKIDISQKFHVLSGREHGEI